jgi:hypothetical protein
MSQEATASVTESAEASQLAARRDQQGVARNAAPLHPVRKPAPNPENFDYKKFVTHNRIHIENGSLFIDPYLVIHPRELDPKNEEALQKKLRLTYSINNPSFFESPERISVALNMGQIIPVTLGAKRSRLMDSIKQFNGEVNGGNGQDVSLAQQAYDRNNPMAAIVRDTLARPEVDPVGLEMLKNSLAVYMLCREKLTLVGYSGRLSDYVKRTASPEQVFSDLQEELGVTPGQMRDAALNGGLEGVGKLLGLDARYVADVKRLADISATRDFSYNMIEHWHIGRQRLGLDATLEQKIHMGMDTRVPMKIDEYRKRVRYQYDVPEPIKKEEDRIAEAMKLVHPTQAALLFELGYEICFTPEATADRIAFHPHIYGLHRKAANDLRDIQGTYRIYVSGKGDLKASMRTFVHEITHNLWPDYFTTDEVKAIDSHARGDRDRIRSLAKLVDERFNDFATFVKAYHAGSDTEKKAVLATMNEQFASYGVTFDSLLPTLRDPYELMWMVKHANDRLHVEGEMYNKSGYESPQERFREVLSRFAELKLVELRDNQPLLKFIAPGLNAIFDDYYIPHLERVRAEIHAQPTTNVPVIQIAPQVAVNDNKEAEDQPKVRNDVGATEEPKVRNDVDNKSASEQACSTHDATPDKSVLSSSVQRATMPAMQALQDMGVNLPH